MARRIIRTFVMAIAAGAVIAANAYIAEPGDLTVTIPFHFESAEKVLPAGEYIIRFDRDQARIRICEDGVYCTAVRGIAFDLVGGQHAAQVVFENSNGQRRLSRVVAPGGSGVEIRNSERAALGTRVSAPWTIVSIPAREICMHRHTGSAIPAAWH